MKIDDGLIGYLEELSRLRLPQEERETVKADLSAILAYIDKLGELDTDGVEPVAHPFSAANRFREDVVVPSHDRDELLANAPVKKDGCFQAPRTVE
ncbi:Asp-tRNA(Asn)/Glu-tRNA(Gln) amidotransferase subunit GatC [Ruminococcaceae bacterium OttesenSCG-928-L11]|nr:Asp-tRNA(Asn)/Glu-tRNA(Gln) amidotransferase subunit GatC [Ruminococcaceae bacterium OttesenSCG-928-L11]